MKLEGLLGNDLHRKLNEINTDLTFWGMIYPGSVDIVIDAFRKKYNIIIYHKAEPFVQPTGDKHKILYCFAVKKCYPGKSNGWNKREYIGESKWCENIYEAKRQAIKIALEYVQARTNNHHK